MAALVGMRGPGETVIEGAAAAALMALDCLAERLPVSQAAVRAGLQRVRLPGRFQVLPGVPPVILDVAHNPDSAGALADQLQAAPPAGRTWLVLGMLASIPFGLRGASSG